MQIFVEDPDNPINPIVQPIAEALETPEGQLTIGLIIIAVIVLIIVLVMFVKKRKQQST